ncbi:aldolase/citrate lyase family protein [Modestobacter sp. VKM Ac-2979]|uniref:HpcH/HpaI aldolase family protein n=1 Tax=unclassified Modestobacter TaxID=2643866 RepID=UPI0022ABA0A2|nr:MULTISPECIES: aldolase/citrate lyase family protein [unclassified Modestobacter]MCZ2811991.1 aldolase/citrate lyase family protein [Modestobacter sp. VKM Ac-2979]MCZ2843715.1 aldolase/citrate lyase family protein [Modestobacter sp. VKM Ac-2980]
MTRDEQVVGWLGSACHGPTRWGTFAVFGEPGAAEIMAEQGFDFLLVDLQHGLLDWADVATFTRAIENVGAAPLVRVPSADAASVGRALDLGAWAVVVPMIETGEQARQMVAATQYPPRGTRSFGPIRGRAAADDAARCFVMVETVAGVENVDEIAAVDGILGVFVGPTDLGISLGIGSAYEVGEPSHDNAIRTVADACARAGVVAAIQTGSSAEATVRASQGFNLVSMRSDAALLRGAAAEMLSAVR